MAFFRNMNLGQARSRSPRSAELLDAFAAAGATSAVNFQTNGTVIFTGDDPATLAESVVTRLTAVTGYADLVVGTDSADRRPGHVPRDSHDAETRRAADNRRRAPTHDAGVSGRPGTPEVRPR